MNNTVRKEIAEIIDTLDGLNCQLESIKESEDEKYDNLPEGIQDSEKGERFMEISDSLESAMDCINDVKDNLEEAKQ